MTFPSDSAFKPLTGAAQDALRALPDFDIVRMIHAKGQLMYLAGALKIAHQSEDLVTIVEDHLSLICRLQDSYRAVEQCNVDYCNQNLVLLDDCKKKAAKIESLERELHILKNSIQEGF